MRSSSVKFAVPLKRTLEDGEEGRHQPVRTSPAKAPVKTILKKPKMGGSSV